MHRRGLKALLAAYRHRWPQESATVARFNVFIDSHPDCFHRSCRVGHITGSAWLVDIRRALTRSVSRADARNAETGRSCRDHARSGRRATPGEGGCRKDRAKPPGVRLAAGNRADVGGWHPEPHDLRATVRACPVRIVGFGAVMFTGPDTTALHRASGSTPAGRVRKRD